MRSIVIVLMLTCFSLMGFSQPHNCDNCIPWNENRKLTWSDFKGKPKKLSSSEALTDSGMSIELECDGNTSTAVVKSFFNPNKSWTKSEDSDYLLGHEQLHFDITELFVRKLRKQLTKFGNDCDALAAHIEVYYNRNYKQYVEYQDRYDRETRHSLDKQKQFYWKKKIAKELEELKAYATLASN